MADGYAAAAKSNKKNPPTFRLVIYKPNWIEIVQNFFRRVILPDLLLVIETNRVACVDFLKSSL